VQERCVPLRPAEPIVVLPSYNGARKLPNLTTLLALLLAQDGVPVLVHGPVRDPGRVTSAEIFHDLGLPIAHDGSDVPHAWARREPVFISTEALCPPLARLLDARWVIGLRNPGHTVAKLIDPTRGGPALRVCNYTHPRIRPGARDLPAAHRRQRDADARHRGRAGGRRAPQPKLDVFVHGAARPDLSLAAQDGVLTELPVLPRAFDAPTTALYIQSVVSGEKPAPARWSRRCSAFAARCPSAPAAPRRSVRHDGEGLAGRAPARRPELLTLRAVRAIRGATLLLVDDLVGDGVLRWARRSARIVHVGKRGGCASTPQEFIDRLMAAEALKGERVVRLKGGDPFVFGRGGEEAERLRAQGIEVEVVNGITAGLAAATSLGAPLTHRAHAHGVMFVTGHARQGGAPLHWPTLAAAAAEGHHAGDLHGHRDDRAAAAGPARAPAARHAGGGGAAREPAAAAAGDDAPRRPGRGGAARGPGQPGDRRRRRRAACGRSRRLRVPPEPGGLIRARIIRPQRHDGGPDLARQTRETEPAERIAWRARGRARHGVRRQSR
jgi:hypothetical protein